MGSAFERLYERAGARYLSGISAATVGVICLFVIPAYSLMLIPLFGLDLVGYLRIVGIWEAFLLPAGAVGMSVTLRRAIAPVARWCAGARDRAQAVAVWHSGVTRLPRVVVGVVGWYMLGSAGAIVVTGVELDFELHGFLIYSVFIVTLVGVAGVVAFLVYEQALRPVIREAVEAIPPGAELAGGTTLSTKAVLIVPVIGFFTAIVVITTALTDLPSELYLGAGVGSSLIASLTIAYVLARALRTSLVGRVETLRDAMRAVDRGDLDVQVPPLAGDEIDEIGRSFNEMVAGLRERAALREDLQASRARIVAASDLARRRVERDLHDGAQQHLVLLRLRLDQLGRQIESGDWRAGETVAAAQGDVQEALRELRDLAHGIYPAVLESDGLPAALKSAARRAGIATDVRCNEATRYPPEMEAAVYFCCLEGLQNAAKHAGDGAQARVTLREEDGMLVFDIADNGAGFDSCTPALGGGLQNMADRIGAIGGTLELHSEPGRGTRVRGRLPVASVVT